MTDPNPQILALIPAYNESAQIANVVGGASNYLPVLVVDDGSTDNTAVLAQEAGAETLRQEPNKGKGAALRLGFGYALEKGYAGVVMLDADGQHDPAEIPSFLNLPETDPPDLLVGARDFSQMPLSRKIANTFGRWTFSWAIRQPILDNQSGYRRLSRQMMAAVLASKEAGFEFEVEMIVTCVIRGYRLAWVPIRTIYGSGHSHIQPWHHTVNYLRLIWQTRQRVKGRS
jgi:glycosyltransferase involved in cell wall biosynthesis